MRTVVHEMRNHLAVAVANIEAIMDGRLPPTQARLSAILQALNELDVLIGDLRLHAIEQAPSELRPIDICSLIANEATAMEATAQDRGISFSVERCDVAHPACHAFLADPVRVGQIVKNVVLNAIRYSKPGGNIAVVCHRGPGQLVFSVSDDGPGIEPAEIGRIFEPGFRGSAATAGSAGSGLGLTVVRSLVEEHGGSVEVASAPGKGATFTIRLPGTISPEGGDAADCLTCAHSRA
ncbi:MAG TPA: HAMP domain-containing sensor histidine kinase [Candidatus Baltobacteraceae bacterium]|nr:HAMP domain-containing sensor histidine kinase [Candidatus Baltobacteraceae bacterium]